MSKSLYKLISVLITSGVVWIWANDAMLSAYNLQLAALLLILYFIIRLILGKNKLYENEYFLEVIFFTNVLFLVLSATGGLISPIFFLTYFLLFASALLFNISFTLGLTFIICVFFCNKANSLYSVLQMFSLLFFSPLAIFFGRVYLRLLESREKIKIINKEKQKLGDAVKKDETGSLLWLSLDFKEEITLIIHKSSEMLSDIGNLTIFQKENLNSINQSAKRILRSGNKLKEDIDRETE